MSERLPRADWMSREAEMVFDALEAAGGGDCARYVGGCVRNAVMGQPVADVDIATVLTPDQTTAALQKAHIRAIPTGIEHGTVTAVVRGSPFEITTLRRDVETDGRRAVVAFTTDWAEDAQRRDFTFNALYASRDGTLHDPVGQGLADAHAGCVVFVGEPETRIREDYLRILRFFRFLAWYGRGGADPAGLAACAALKAPVAKLAAERISKELLKLLAAPDPRPAVRLMAETGVLQVVLPDARDLRAFEVLVDIDADPELRLAALLPQDTALAARMAAALRLSNAQRDRWIAAVGTAVEADAGPALIRAMVYRDGAQAASDRLKLAWAHNPGAADAWRAGLTAADWTAPRFPLTGEDAIAAGLPKGPAVGKALRAVEAAWIAGDFAEDRLALLGRLKEIS